jgi:hypothetical protein
VTIAINGAVYCTAVIVNGKGSCALPGFWDAGRYKITASYSGDSNYAGSTATQYLTVVRAKTSTSLTLSKATITYGRETAEKMTVTISAPTQNSATGKVTIRAGQTTICVITLKPGNQSNGSCTLKAAQLRPGTYHLTASYPGDFDYVGSASSLKTLKVVP